MTRCTSRLCPLRTIQVANPPDQCATMARASVGIFCLLISATKRPAFPTSLKECAALFPVQFCPWQPPRPGNACHPYLPEKHICCGEIVLHLHRCIAYGPGRLPMNHGYRHAVSNMVTRMHPRGWVRLWACYAVQLCSLDYPMWFARRVSLALREDN